MLTYNWCDDCNEWREFHKAGRNPKEGVSWKCTTCEHKTLKFPEYESPIQWVLSGRRPK